MFRLYRELEKGEFIVGFGDCAQGGDDSNFATFMSKTNMDIPLVFQMQGVAAEATPYIRQALEWIYDKTGVRPVFAFENQNGGASEMYNLNMTNQEGKFKLYHPKDLDGEDKDKLGFDTTGVTRPKMLGEWLTAFDSRLIKIYDKEMIEQHQTFIVNKNGRPEADANTHDDGVMSPAGAYQLYQTENPIEIKKRTRPKPKKTRFHL
jgi:hypothetical protein